MRADTGCRACTSPPSFDLPPRGLVQVPAAALLFRASGTQVAGVNAQGRIVMRDVTIARDDGNMVELSSGVKPGERLVLNLSSQISSGRSGRDRQAAMSAQRLQGPSLAIAFATGFTLLVSRMRRRSQLSPSRRLRCRSTMRHRAQTTGTGSPDLAAWWQALKDPELESLIDRAITANPDVEIALDRLQAARTYEAGMLGVVLPDLEGTAAAARGTGTDLTRGRAAQSLVSADNSAGLKHINEIGGFDSVWELDVFGKYRREMQAARADTPGARGGTRWRAGLDHFRCGAGLHRHAGRPAAGRDTAGDGAGTAGIPAHRTHPLSARHHQRTGCDAGRSRTGRYPGAAGAGAGADQRRSVRPGDITRKISRRTGRRTDARGDDPGHAAACCRQVFRPSCCDNGPTFGRPSANWRHPRRASVLPRPNSFRTWP